MRKARINNHDGTVWFIHENGDVERTDVPAPYNVPSGRWYITGAVQLNNFGYITKRWSLTELLTNPSAIPWQFKNGKVRTFLTDIDHGTPRIMMSPRRTVSTL